MTKAEILNKQFNSVFTQEDKSNIPKLPGPHYPPIVNLDITTISCRILKELAVELTPALTAIFNQSIGSGSLPMEWTMANITPIYKKGNNLTRPKTIGQSPSLVWHVKSSNTLYARIYINTSSSMTYLPVYSMASRVDDHVRLNYWLHCSIY